MPWQDLRDQVAERLGFDPKKVSNDEILFTVIYDLFITQPDEKKRKARHSHERTVRY